MNITIKQLKAFVSIADTRSFAESCELLHLSQPALSITIKNFEETIGGKLFIRNTRALALTPEGKQFLPIAQRLLADWQDAFIDLNDIFSLNRGKLSLAAMPSFANSLLPQYIKKFRDNYPEINISIHDIIAEDAVTMVQSGKVELALTFESGESEGLEFTPLFADNFIAAIPPNHVLLQEKNITWQTLANHAFIALQPSSKIRQRMEYSLQQHDIKLNVEFESNQLATIGKMVSAGLGISAVPEICANLFKALGVECRSLSKPVISRNIGFITRRRYPLSKAAQTFVDMMLAGFQLE